MYRHDIRGDGTGRYRAVKGGGSNQHDPDEGKVVLLDEQKTERSFLRRLDSPEDRSASRTPSEPRPSDHQGTFLRDSHSTLDETIGSRPPPTRALIHGSNSVSQTPTLTYFYCTTYFIRVLSQFNKFSLYSFSNQSLSAWSNFSLNQASVALIFITKTPGITKYFSNLGNHCFFANNQVP